ncbi:MAG: hypothetical protein WD071_12115 [Pseudohongiella sp.]|uniref:hypothetical protein n=1 Tax=Pseudohongiella sp. TaxID=1979412 RepID=UPI00349FF8C0
MFNVHCKRVLILIMGLLAPAALFAQTAQSPATQSFDGEVLRDPTRPFAVTGASRGSSGNAVDGDRSLSLAGLAQRNFTVTFIRDGGSSPMAVINDQRVTLGDLVEGATVVAISSDAVTLSVNGLEQVINTFGPTVKEVSGTEF